jgi:uncharacterized phiE125 gp8 family phage protein
MPLEVGSVIPFQFTVRDAGGTLVNPTTISVTITRPDGTSPAVVNPTNPPAVTGIFPVDHTATMVGLYWAAATTTGPTDVSPAQSFYVHAPSDTVTIVALADCKEHLRISGTGDDDKLRRMLVTATSMCEKRTGRWRRATVTETHDGGRSQLLLREPNIVSITTVTESGTALTAGDYVLDRAAGLLTRGSSTSPSCWAWGIQNVAVAMVAGPDDQVIPDDIQLGVKELVRHLWDTQRGGMELPAGGAESGFGDFGVNTFSIPRRVLELWHPWMRDLPRGFA